MNDFVNVLKSAWIRWIFWALGGIAKYLTKVKSWKAFTIPMFFINIAIAWIVAIAVGNLIQPMWYSQNLNYFIVMLAGNFSNSLLEVLEENKQVILDIIYKSLKK